MFPCNIFLLPAATSFISDPPFPYLSGGYSQCVPAANHHLTTHTHLHSLISSPSITTCPVAPLLCQIVYCSFLQKRSSLCLMFCLPWFRLWAVFLSFCLSVCIPLDLLTCSNCLPINIDFERLVNFAFTLSAPSYKV